MSKIILDEKDIYRGNLILVNSDFKIKNYISQKNMEIVNQKYPTVLLEKNVSKVLQNILREIHSQEQIVPVSGYRSLEEQSNIYHFSLKENGEEFTKKYVALPNASEHQTGLAIDLGYNQGTIDFIRPTFPYVGICEKFRTLAYQYGFIQRYTENKKNITKIASEEWHFRYVGYPHSEIIQELNFCLEEYIAYLKRYPYPEYPFRYKNYEISYLPFQNEKIEIELGTYDTISGNNIDGFIITTRK